MNIVKKIIKTNITLLKGVILIISFGSIFIVGCSSNYSKHDIFFKKHYTTPDKVGCLNVFIHQDTVFKNRNTYSAIDNHLEYLVLNAKERKTLKNILTNLKGENIKTSYRGGNYDYAFYWEFLSENIETEVLDSINPNSLKPLYSFILNKSEVSKINTKKIDNLIYSSININSVTELGGKNIGHHSNVKKDKMLYLIWRELMKSKQSDFYDIESINDFNYEVKFSYLINSSNKFIERIYLKNSSSLAIKFKDSLTYKVIKINHTFF